MKIAVLSDIHGNIAALDAVLADAADRGADRIVNLGDICSGGLFPVETADRLMALARQDKAFVIFGHSPEQWPDLRKAPDSYA